MFIALHWSSFKFFKIVKMHILLQEARLQELDEEHNLLQGGLQVIEKARKWYFKRITAIQEEKLHLQNEDQYSLEQVTKTKPQGTGPYLLLVQCTTQL